MEKKVMKKSMGRQKIEMKKIEKKSKLQVTFSKRRAGLFRKVAQFCTLYGVDAAVLVESPGGKVFAFGNPSVETVISNYFGHNCSSEATADEEAIKKSQDENELKKKGDKEFKTNDLFWWNKSVDDMDLQELEEFKNVLLGLKSDMMRKRNEMDMAMTLKTNMMCKSNHNQMDMGMPIEIPITENDNYDWIW